MITLEQEIEELKKKHANLELDAYNLKLKEKFDKLKALEGTVEVRIIKTSKTTRHASIVYHVKYEMMVDTWKSEKEFQHNYIGQTLQQITIMEAPRKPYKRYEIKTEEITPNGYNGKIHVEEEHFSYSYATNKTISVDEFNTIWNIAKVTSANVLDGVLDIKNVPWMMNGTREDYEFKDNSVNDYQRLPLDIPHIFLTQEESWKLENKFTRIFLNKNIYLITPNSLEALDEWFKDELRSDDLSYSLCASVGERWRGSRIEEYRVLVKKIKNYNKK